MVRSFKNHDKDGKHEVTFEDFGNMVRNMGYKQEDMAEQLKEMKFEKEGFVSWDEFLQVMQSVSIGHQMRASNKKHSSEFEALVEADNGISSFMMAEVSTFARAINQILQDEPALQDRLPIDPNNDDLFDTVSDGLVLAYLLQAIDPDLIDMTKIKQSGKANTF